MSSSLGFVRNDKLHTERSIVRREDPEYIAYKSLAAAIVEQAIKDMEKELRDGKYIEKKWSSFFGSDYFKLLIDGDGMAIMHRCLENFHKTGWCLIPESNLKKKKDVEEEWDD